jgi:hypothetical protein
MVARTRLDVTLYVHCQSCCSLSPSYMSTLPVLLHPISIMHVHIASPVAPYLHHACPHCQSCWTLSPSCMSTLPVLLHPISIMHVHIASPVEPHLHHACPHCQSCCTLSPSCMSTSFFLTTYQWGKFSTPFSPQGDVLFLTHVYSSFPPSFITTVDFVSTLTSGYSSLFQSHIIPSFSFTLGNGTVFFHRESYFCLLCHMYLGVSLLTNMLHFLSITCNCVFLIHFYKFCLDHG